MQGTLIENLDGLLQHTLIGETIVFKDMVRNFVIFLY